MSEFDLIDQYFKHAATLRDDVKLDIGDDCALLAPPPGKQLAVSTDTLISGVHFPENTSAYDIGYKSLAVNLSDIAAMGAQPAWVSLAISLPAADQSWVKAFMQGFGCLLDRYNVSLIGGDTTRGSLSITVNIIGFVDTEKSLKRNQAKPGDIICVTGTIGDARLGLEAILNNYPINPDIQYCIDRLNQPSPAIEAGMLLPQYSQCAIDLSDGLLADLQHICTASDCGARLNLEAIPLSNALRSYYSDKPAWDLILNAGDDYELCFTCSKNNIETLRDDFANNDLAVSCIGEITTGNEIECYLNDTLLKLAPEKGYDHFAK